MSPYVSVIVPCYKQAQFLAQAVRSVMAQRFAAWECIIVNDGSPDATAEVSRSLVERDPRIRYVEQSNQGLPAARNAGIDRARGRYLHFLDADDLLAPGGLGWLVTAMGGAEDRIVVMGHRFFGVDCDEAGAVDVTPVAARPSLPSLVHFNPAPVHSYLSSRRAVDAVGGFELMLRACEDWDLWLRLALAGAELIHVPQIGAYYRRYPGTMSGDRQRMLSARTEVLLRAHEQVLRIPALTERWGADVMQAAFRLRRRWMVQFPEARYTARLSEAIRQMRQRGLRLPRSWPARVLEHACGTRSESLVLAWLKWTRPQIVREYQDQFV
jgi:glycosyltransferase involved in cell wall biosynthesis